MPNANANASNGNNAVNDAPTTNAAAAGGVEDAASIAVALTGSDTDGTVQSFTLSTLPANGTLYTDAGLATLAATGVAYAATAQALTLYFVPTASWNGVTGFDFAATDDGGLADASPATATITVSAVNDAPTTNAAAAGGVEDAASIAVALTGSDTDGTVQSFTLSTLPANGTLYTDAGLTIAAAIGVAYAATAEAQTLYFVPNANWNGVTNFTYAAKDDGGAVDATPATATITVTAVNAAPVSQDDGVATAVNTAAVIAVLANDSDPNSDPLSVQSITQGANGTVVDNGDGTVTYTPNAAFTGMDTFTYTASDGQGGTDTATVTVGVGTALEGTAGDDTLTGTSAGGEVILGYGGNDTIKGLNGADALFGGAGNDDLKGQGGADKLYGEDGNDMLKGQGGADELYGGGGDDTLHWDLADLVVDGGIGTDTLMNDGNDVNLTNFAGTISGIEIIDLGKPGGQTLTLSAQDLLDISDTDVLSVLGDPADTVEVGTGWTDGGFDGGGNHIYTQMVGVNLATLLLDPDLTANADITS